jgi:hypothetical protein
VDLGQGQVGGPFNAGQLQQAVGQGQLTASTMVWAAGMAAWTPAGQVPALAALFQAPPPPPSSAMPPPAPSGSSAEA